MGKIAETFKHTTKWGATNFTDKYDVLAFDSKTGEGLQSHLHDIRYKTGEAIISLEKEIESLKKNLEKVKDELKNEKIVNELKNGY